MATLYTISGILAGADGVPTGGTVTIRLSQPAVIAATGEVVPRELKPTVNASTGAWSQGLYANVDMSPAGTYYTAIERTSDGAVAKYDFTVAQANAKLADRVTTTIPTSGSAPRFTTLTVDGAATFTAGPVVIGTDPGGAQILRVGGSGHLSGLLTLDAGITVTAGAVTLPAASVADSALSANVALLSGAQTISGVKTFSANPVFNASAIPESAIANLTGDLAARALDSAVVHLAGAETISGSKTFSAGLTVSAGGLTVSAGGAVITGNSSISTQLTIGTGNPVVISGGAGANTALVTASTVNGNLNIAANGNGSLIFNLASGTGSTQWFNGAGGSIMTLAASGLLTVSGGLAVTGNSGFNGTAPIAKPTVSGAKSGNAALASLLTALAAYGLVTDSTTA